MKITSQLQKKIKHSIALLALGGLFLSYSTSAEAPLDIRVALVIGNAAYKNVPALANSTNDAKSMATVLRKLGFTVVEVVDGSKDQMSKAIAQMQGLLKSRQAVGMLYYAGHGLQLDWRNFMVPIDAKLEEASDVPKQTIDIENVIDVLRKSGTRMNIIVLDACRDNPFAEKASGKGLAQLDAPPGTYLAFATSPGNVAEDGDVAEGNGLFTQFLLKELQKPARIEDVFKRVRLQVRQKSQGRQIPWDSSSLEDDFAFNDGKKFTFNPEDLIKEAQQAKEKEAKLKQEAEVATRREKELAEQRALEQQRLVEAQKIQEAAARQKAEAEAKERERQLALAAEQERLKAQVAAQALERARTEEAQRLRDLEQAKLQAAEDARRSKLTQEEAREQQFAQEKAEWDKIKETKNKEALYAFLNRFPSGLMSELASAKLERLDKAQITPQADKQGMVQSFFTRRYREGEQFDFVVKDGFTNLEKGTWIYRVNRSDDEGADISATATWRPSWNLRAFNDGSINSDGSGAYDPPYIAMPAGVVQVGKKWFLRSNFKDIRTNNTSWVEIQGKVIAKETVQVPAGTFETFKIQLDFMYQSGIRRTNYLWFDPSIGPAIKFREEYTMPNGGRNITLRELTKLTAAK
jgi:hypothetical protein